MQREQFIELVKAEQEGLRRFLLALTCGNRDEADDLAQEALIKAYLAAEANCQPAKFRQWLYRIAYNTFISSHRTAERCFVSINGSAENNKCMTTLDISLSPDKRYRYQELYMALAQLPPKERVAVVLYYLNERSVKEICKITSTTDGTVRQLLMRGRNHLRQKLVDYGKR